MLEHISGDIHYFTFNSFPNGSLTHAIFARAGGVSPQPWASLNMSISTGDSAENTRANRVRAFGALELHAESMADVWQVHGTETIRADEPRGSSAFLLAGVAAAGRVKLSPRTSHNQGPIHNIPRQPITT